jgi:hypothetical protein
MNNIKYNKITIKIQHCKENYELRRSNFNINFTTNFLCICWYNNKHLHFCCLTLCEFDVVLVLMPFTVTCQLEMQFIPGRTNSAGQVGRTTQFCKVASNNF